MATFADVDAFFARWNGKSVDRDGAFGAQCVDFAAQYTAELFGVGYLPTPVTGGARDIYERFSLGQYFDKIPNTPDFVPHKGDVVVWTAFSNNQFGHIAIATGEGDTTWFNSYDQNWNAQRVEKVRHNYNSVLGVLRPKGLVEQTNQGDVMDLDAAKKVAEMAAGRNPNDQANINDLQKNHVGGSAVNDIKAWYSSGERRDFLKRQADEKAVLQKQNQDLQSQVKSQQDQINALNEKLKQGGLPQETVDQVKETNTIVKWIKAKLEGIFK